MSAHEVMNECQARDVRLSVANGSLTYDAPKGALSPDLLALLKEHKADLLVALQADDLREHFEERAGILEYDAGLPRSQAELEGARITATYARNAGYTWAALRSALSAYPEILASLPEKAGLVDSLPLGVSKVAVFSSWRVVRQGAFTGAHELCG